MPAWAWILIPDRGARRDGRADTEDLRQAVVHYRSLFEELLGDEASESRVAQ